VADRERVTLDPLRATAACSICTLHSRMLISHVPSLFPPRALYRLLLARLFCSVCVRSCCCAVTTARRHRRAEAVEQTNVIERVMDVRYDNPLVDRLRHRGREGRLQRTMQRVLEAASSLLLLCFGTVCLLLYLSVQSCS
jgi:hypothetical protein